MSKRTWFAGFFFIAFALALAHNSIPHTHPEATNEKQHNHPHSSGSKSHEHQKDSGGHTHNHDESERDLPVFSHFSNADYLGSPVFKFNANEKQLIELLQPQAFLFLTPSALHKPLLFPKARDLPSDRGQSSESLRAPPFLS